MNTSLLKALDILGSFSAERPRRSLTELSREMNIPKSTVHRLLRTLQSRGFIEQVKGEEYSLGSNIIALTQAVRVNVEVRDRAATVARSLAEASGESVYVAVAEATGVLYIYAVETSKRLRARTAVGDRAPFYCTSIGKACLAFMPDQERNALIAALNLIPATKHTITSAASLAADLEETIHRGYAKDCQEHEEGIFCLAAPFRDETGNVVGAISVSGSDREILGLREDVLATSLMEASEQISNRLGYVASRRSLIPQARERSRV